VKNRSRAGILAVREPWRSPFEGSEDLSFDGMGLDASDDRRPRCER
jgi:hypothetical protein